MFAVVFNSLLISLMILAVFYEILQFGAIDIQGYLTKPDGTISPDPDNLAKLSQAY
jgi:hypothetical protein